MSEDSAVKLKPFSRKEEVWAFWAPIFMAHADVKGYWGIAEGNPNDDEPITDARKIKLRKLNKPGFSELMALMCNVKVAFMLVRKSQMPGLPNGSLFEAWKKLKARYGPKGVETAQEVI